MKPYEIEVLTEMYNEEIIGYNYLATEKAASKIKWTQIAAKHKVKGGFTSVVKHLKAKGLVTDQGKSLAVVSLTKQGVAFVLGQRE